MKKVLCLIFTVSLVLLLNGCGEWQAAEPSSTTSAVIVDGAVADVYRITYQWTLLSNDCVGSDWRKGVTCNGQPINSGDTIAAAKGSRITVEGTAIEDDKYPDTGSGTIELPLEDGAQGSAHITVREDHGIYTGNIAEWTLSCHVDRVR